MIFRSKLNISKATIPLQWTVGIWGNFVLNYSLAVLETTNDKRHAINLLSDVPREENTQLS
jgi:hypothetical protein